eukprot:4643661-Prorocentrum_lima.AAC.1
MTSSLVGSEMCIRDRRLLIDLHVFMGGRSTGWDHPTCAHVSLHSIDPVSYTHLTLPTICSV